MISSIQSNVNRLIPIPEHYYRDNFDLCRFAAAGIDR